MAHRPARPLAAAARDARPGALMRRAGAAVNNKYSPRKRPFGGIARGQTRETETASKHTTCPRPSRRPQCLTATRQPSRPSGKGAPIVVHPVLAPSGALLARLPASSPRRRPAPGAPSSSQVRVDHPPAQRARTATYLRPRQH
eukprot:1601321-Prymnesium_polylepis.2